MSTSCNSLFLVENDARWCLCDSGRDCLGHYAETVCCAESEDGCCRYDIRAVVALCVLAVLFAACTCGCIFFSGACRSHAAEKTQFVPSESVETTVVVTLDLAACDSADISVDTASGNSVEMKKRQKSAVSL